MNAHYLALISVGLPAVLIYLPLQTVFEPSVSFYMQPDPHLVRTPQDTEKTPAPKVALNQTAHWSFNADITPQKNKDKILGFSFSKCFIPLTTFEKI